MASDPQLELRVSRLENDRDSMYELLTGVIATQQEHTLRFVKIDSRFDKMDDRLGNMDDRLGKMDDRLDKMDDRFDKMDDRFDNIDDRLGNIGTTLTEVVRRLPNPS